jgi:hypothetical protein
MPSSSITLGTDVATRQPVTLAGESKDLGLYMIGAPGMGKSTLMLNMILQDISQGNGVCVLDPHGDLITDILARLDAPADRVIILDPTDYQHPFGLNLFQCADIKDPTMRARTISYVMGIFEKLWGDDGLHPSWGAQLEDILRHVTQAFVHAQKYTLVDVPLFLENDQFRASVISSLSPQIQEYWERSYNPRKDQLNYRASTLNKVRKFTDDEILYPILGQSKSTINFSQAMENNKIILASLPVGKIGDEAVSLLGSLLVGQLLQATLARVEQPQAERSPVSLYCDEYYYFATSDFPRFFAEGRKFKVSTIIAHQGRYQLDTISKQATLNVANRIVFRVSGRDARELSHEFTYSPPPAKQLILRRPFDLLLRTPHANPVVYDTMETIRQHLDRIEKRSSTAIKYNKYLEPAIDAANDMLYELMLGDITLSDQKTAFYMLQIMKRLVVSSFGKDTIGIEYTIHKNADYTPPADLSKPSNSWAGRANINEEDKALLELYHFVWVMILSITVRGDYIQVADANWKSMELLPWSGPRKHLGVDLNATRKMLEQIVGIARILVNSPLYEKTVIDEPGVDPKLADIVSLLANLNKYHARSRIQVGDSMYEGTITTLEPTRPRAAGKYRQAISQASRGVYTVPLETVYDQIRARQRGDDGPSGDRKGPQGIDEE